MSNPPPILAGKDFAAPSVFAPENLLREARRQKNLPGSAVPEVCLLDPDGDIVRALSKTGRSRRSAEWACYHTDLFEFEEAGEGANAGNEVAEQAAELEEAGGGA